MTFRARLAAAAAAALVLAACQQDSTKGSTDKPSSGGEDGPALVPQTTEERSAVVARVDGVTITVDQLQQSINQQSPYIRARYASKEQKRVFLNNMIRFEILAKEAARRGLDRDPEVVQTMKSAMITKLLRAELASGIKPDDIQEAELRAFYDANPERFNRPEAVRVSAIVLEDKQQADTVAGLARGAQGASNKGFRELVDRYSTDGPSKLRGGDLRYLTRESTEAPPPVVEAAFALRRTGDVAGPIAAGRSFYVIKQTGRRSAMKRSFDQARREIQNELYKDRRENAQKRFVEQLKTRAKIEVFEDNLKKVRVDTSSRAPQDPDQDDQDGHDGRNP
jgi:peptidyl-prolyl cis-trans isomerase C